MIYVCPRVAGGLGLRNACKANQALLMKVRWKLCMKPNYLWVHVVREKYRCENDVIAKIDENRQGTKFWRDIVRRWDYLKPHLSWKIRNDHQACFWSDLWVSSQSQLSQHCLTNNNGGENILICFYVDVRGQWDMQEIYIWLVSNLLKAMKIGFSNWTHMFGVALDRIWWCRKEFVFNQKWTSTHGLYNNIHDMLCYLKMSAKERNMVDHHPNLVVDGTS